MVFFFGKSRKLKKEQDHKKKIINNSINAKANDEELREMQSENELLDYKYRQKIEENIALKQFIKDKCGSPSSGNLRVFMNSRKNNNKSGNNMSSTRYHTVINKKCKELEDEVNRLRVEKNSEHHSELIEKISELTAELVNMCANYEALEAECDAHRGVKRVNNTDKQKMVSDMNKIRNELENMEKTKTSLEKELADFKNKNIELSRDNRHLQELLKQKNTSTRLSQTRKNSNQSHSSHQCAKVSKLEADIIRLNKDNEILQTKLNNCNRMKEILNSDKAKLISELEECRSDNEELETELIEKSKLLLKLKRI